MPSISIKNLKKTYSGANGVEALADVNLEIKDGEFVCILGPSGCGKSTFLEILAGLQSPTAGQILVGDTEVKGPSRDITSALYSRILPCFHGEPCRKT